MPSKPQIPDCTGISFTNIIYTKLSTFPSREISGYPFGERPLYSELVLIFLVRMSTTNGHLFLLSMETSWISPTSQPDSIEPRADAPKTASFSWAVTCQNSSKNHLFHELENTQISRWHHVSKMTPQMLILPISSPNKCQFFAKIQIFIENFSLTSD